MTSTEKPEVEFQAGPPPADLTITDIIVGDGAEAVRGGVVDVHYVGVDYETGEEFDSSWDRGQSANFPLDRLIPGWQEGIPGMKVGGRRQLTVPPELAYGPAGAGHRLSGRTLVFVIDLLGVG
ncbi:FKBP-type peptidyl-prolyl cis-trans isomerase [Gordonia rubripertincta]|uniref:FKBP-type peptidyl-prolyl cis-trans isomerase n=1 Tax=Gordonia rubripertincta TaxID=36822 RepID=UPI0015FD76B3|nr:FKBP-type peptidyl-prolyl cis-trans isomerase [Gordonia rubripertincta]QMU22992.1 FKBP-type peptidyl-prolyl cis-trans isomerase [Gordonia rubripertincta]